MSEFSFFVIINAGSRRQVHINCHSVKKGSSNDRGDTWMSAKFAAFEDGPLQKEAIFLIALVFELMMAKNRFKVVQYTREDVN